jgi:hypothetical protein
MIDDCDYDKRGAPISTGYRFSDQARARIFYNFYGDRYTCGRPYVGGDWDYHFTGVIYNQKSGSGYLDSRRKGGGALANIEDPGFHALCERVLENTDHRVEKELVHDIQRYYAQNLPAFSLCSPDLGPDPSGNRRRLYPDQS